MALILHIETSTQVCSVAVSLDSKVLFSKEERSGPSHATLIGSFLDEALSVVEREGLRVEAVAVSAGPGSYTGLRIGVSAAKGVCYALKIPFIALSTLEIMADTCRRSEKWPTDAWIRPVLDARRMEVYTALFEPSGLCREVTRALVVDEHSFDTELANHRVVFAGNGTTKLKTSIHADQAYFDETLLPLAANMVHLAEKAFQASQFADLAYFEPFYIKDFIATVKKNLIPER